jgi:hypothetical protein
MKNLDLISNKVEFRIDGKTKIKTAVGGSLTIILFLIAILAFSTFGEDLFKRKRPNLMIIESLEEESKITNPVKFAISLRDKNAETSIKPHIKVNDNIVYTNALIPCEQTELFKSYTYDIYSYIHHDIKTYYCMSENIYKTSDIILEIM